jgi:hypothetical protein
LDVPRHWESFGATGVAVITRVVTELSGKCI